MRKAGGQTAAARQNGNLSDEPLSRQTFSKGIYTSHCGRQPRWVQVGNSPFSPERPARCDQRPMVLPWGSHCRPSRERRLRGGGMTKAGFPPASFRRSSMNDRYCCITHTKRQRNREREMEMEGNQYIAQAM